LITPSIEVRLASRLQIERSWPSERVGHLRLRPCGLRYGLDREPCRAQKARPADRTHDPVSPRVPVPSGSVRLFRFGIGFSDGTKVTRTVHPGRSSGPAGPGQRLLHPVPAGVGPSSTRQPSRHGSSPTDLRIMNRLKTLELERNFASIDRYCHREPCSRQAHLSTERSCRKPRQNKGFRGKPLSCRAHESRCCHALGRVGVPLSPAAALRTATKVADKSQRGSYSPPPSRGRGRRCSQQMSQTARSYLVHRYRPFVRVLAQPS
jgi:hypothetical protein